MLKEKQIYAPCIVQEPPSTAKEKATTIRFRKPGPIYFKKKYATLSPEPIVKGNPMTNTAEE